MKMKKTNFPKVDFSDRDCFPVINVTMRQHLTCHERTSHDNISNSIECERWLVIIIRKVNSAARPGRAVMAYISSQTKTQPTIGFEGTRSTILSGSYSATGGAGCLESIDILPVAGPVDCGAGSLEHSIGTSMAGMQVFHDFLPQASGDDRSVIQEHYVTQCGQAMAGLEVRFQLEVPVLNGVRYTTKHSLVEQAVGL